MAQEPINNVKRKKQNGGGKYAALAVLFLVLLTVGGYFLADSKYQKRDDNRIKSTTVEEKLKKQPLSPEIIPQSQVSSALTAVSNSNSKPEKKNISPTEKIDSLPIPVNSQNEAKLAIIIDDMGSAIIEAQKLASIGVPITFSIIPGLRFYKEVSDFASKNSIETMIHIPMQSKGWPGRRLEANGLLIAMDEAELQKRVKDFVEELPNAVGVNNHMGSEFTEHEDKMRSVIEVLKQKDLFFVDSVTSPKSSGLRVAQQLGVKSSRRSVFLDNEQNEIYIKGQLHQAIKIAKKQGGVIAICHPHKATIETLIKVLPTLKSEGITLVRASALVR